MTNYSSKTVGYFEFLDMLRETGVTNMFGAAPYLSEEFNELSRSDARKVLGEWMNTFGDGTESAEERAMKADSANVCKTCNLPA